MYMYRLNFVDFRSKVTTRMFISLRNQQNINFMQRINSKSRQVLYSAAQIYPNYAYAYYTLVFCVYTYVYTRICVCEYTRICPFVMSFCRTNEISLSLDLNVKDGNNFCVGVSKPWLFVDPCLLIAIQLCWNFKPYCFYFFPKSALLNWGCGLSILAVIHRHLGYSTVLYPRVIH